MLQLFPTSSSLSLDIFWFCITLKRLLWSDALHAMHLLHLFDPSVSVFSSTDNAVGIQMVKV